MLSRRDGPGESAADYLHDADSTIVKTKLVRGSQPWPCPRRSRPSPAEDLPRWVLPPVARAPCGAHARIAQPISAATASLGALRAVRAIRE